MTVSKLLIATALTVVAVTIAATLLNAQRIQRGLPLPFAALDEVSRVEVLGRAGEVLLRGVFSTKEESASEVEREALLSPVAGTARGLAEIEIERTKAAPTKDEIEVTVEGLAPNTTHKLMIDGHEVTVFTTTSHGKADLKLSRAFPKQ